MSSAKQCPKHTTGGGPCYCEGSIYHAHTRKLNPRVCRGCERVFMPTTALQRYGSDACKKLGNNHQCRAVPGTAIDHT